MILHPRTANNNDQFKLLLITLALLSLSIYSSTLVAKADLIDSNHAFVIIDGDNNFTVENGVTAGTGTPSDPYIIEGWRINATSTGFSDHFWGIQILNTSAHFVIRNVTVYSSGLESSGISFLQVSNGVIENVTVKNNFRGISLSQSEDIIIQNCQFLHNQFGLRLGGLRYTVINNVFTSNGITLTNPRNALENFNSHTIVNNTVNGKPLKYYKNLSGLNLKNLSVGQLILANCVDVTIANMAIEHTDTGIIMAYIQNGTITNCTLLNNQKGAEVWYCQNVTIEKSYLEANRLYGVFMLSDMYTTNNFVLKHNYISNSQYGIEIEGSYVGLIHNNVLITCGTGLRLMDANNVTIHANTLTNNGCGVKDLNIWNLPTGINIFYHNNFINNTVQMDSNQVGVWDKGYPNGGNYWTDYSGVDECNGVNQDLSLHRDGIGDTPNILNVHNTDEYPLMAPHSEDMVLVILTSPYGSPKGSGWHEKQETIIISIDPIIYLNNMTRRVFQKWTGNITSTNSTVQVVVKESIEALATWQTQHRLQIQSDHGTPTGDGWYPEQTQVKISIEDVTAMEGLVGLLGGTYVFKTWTGDLESLNTTLNLVLKSPLSLQAEYHADYTQPTIVISVIVIGISSVTTYSLARRKVGGQH